MHSKWVYFAAGALVMYLYLSYSSASTVSTS